MSVDSTENNVNSHEEKPEKESGTIDLSNKLIQIGPQKYFVDMKESTKARFFRIVEVIPRSKRSRIVVPMVTASDFISKLEEIYNFSATYVIPADPAAVFNKEKPFAHSVSLTTVSHRRYYFDLLVDDERVLKLRMSYVFSDRRDNVHINIDAVESLLNILKDFLRDFPARPTDEDTAPKSNFVRRTNGDKRGGARFGGKRGGQSNFYFRPTNATTPPGPRVNLRVLEDPAPSSVIVNAKKFTLEVVEGTNTFLRVTEIINNNRKSTLHVPIEACVEIGQLMEKMVGRLSFEPKPIVDKQVTSKESVF